jgi:hypothetical protein
VKISVKRSPTGKSNAGASRAQSLLSKASLLNEVPRSSALFQSSSGVRAQPAAQPSPAAVAKVLPTAPVNTANIVAANVAGGSGAAALRSASTVAAANSMQNHISDMMDTRMDMMSDMAEAGMLGGGMFGGMGGLGSMGGLGMGGLGMGSGLMGGGLGGFGGLGMMAAFS